MGAYTPQEAQPLNIGIRYSNDIRKLKACDLPTTLLKRQQYELEGSMATLLSLLPSDTSTNDKEYWEIEVPAAQAFVSMCDLGKANCEAEHKLTVDRANAGVPSQLYKNVRTGEIVYITARPDDHNIIVKRGQGFVGAQPIQTGDKFVFISTSYEQASVRGTPIHRGKKQKIFNNYAIVRDPWGASKTAACVAKGMNPNTNTYDEAEAGALHLQSIDNLIWSSEWYEGMHNGKPISRFNGFDASVRLYAPQNIFIAPATLDYGTFTEWLDSTRTGMSVPGLMSRDMLLVAGYKAIQVIQDMIALDGQKVQLQNGTGQVYGMTYSTIVTLTGKWHIMHSPYFDKLGQSSSIRIVNMKSMRLKYLCDRKHKHTPFDGADSVSGLDAIGGDYLSEVTLQMLAPETNGIIYNLCKAGCRPPCIYTQWEPLALCKDECGRVVPQLTGEDGTLIFNTGDTCEAAPGLDPIIEDPDPIHDKCGKLICPPSCEDADYWAIVQCSSLTAIHTTDGDIDFSSIDFSTEAGVAEAESIFNTWLNDNMRKGSGTITVQGGVVIVTVSDIEGFELISIDPYETQFVACTESCSCS